MLNHELVTALAALLATSALPTSGRAGSRQSSEVVDESVCYVGPLHVRVLNPDQSPAANVGVCIFGGSWFSATGEYPPPRTRDSHTDERGELHRDSVRECIVPSFIYAFDEPRKLAGFRPITRKAEIAATLVVQLRPARWVTGEVSSSELAARDQSPDWISAALSLDRDPKMRARNLHFVAEGRFQFLVPPGDYGLSLQGDRLEWRNDPTILVGQSDEPLDLGRIDLKMSTLSKLTGRPAPEWSVVGWSDGRDRTLASLRGRAVVLCFWQKNSDPWRTLEDVRKMHDRLKATRVQLLAIHYPESNGFDELTSTLTAFSKQAPLELDVDPRKWPFLNAIDKPNAIPRETDYGCGQTGRSYGELTTGIFILIDADGVVRANSRDSTPHFEEELERQLNGASPKP